LHFLAGRIRQNVSHPAFGSRSLAAAVLTGARAIAVLIATDFAFVGLATIPSGSRAWSTISLGFGTGKNDLLSGVLARELDGSANGGSSDDCERANSGQADQSFTHGALLPNSPHRRECASS
jgi:hypothetical protein